MNFPKNSSAKRRRSSALRVVSRTRLDDASEEETTAVSNSRFIGLYRQTVDRLADLIHDTRSDDRDGFFHAMRFMQLVGLSSDEVVERLDFSQENVCRWMSGQRCPHPELRRHVLDQCLEIVLSKANADVPPQFLRA